MVPLGTLATFVAPVEGADRMFVVAVVWRVTFVAACAAAGTTAPATAVVDKTRTRARVRFFIVAPLTPDTSR